MRGIRIQLLILLMIVSGFQYVFPQNYDLIVNITDKMINKLITAIGPVSGVEEYSILTIKGNCKWTVENAVIKLDDNKSWFEADVSINHGNFSYTDRINGLIKVNYNKQNDKLELKIEHAFVDLKIRILGKEKLIKTIDLANYYKTPFVFDGPASYAEEFSFEMPDGSIKKLKPLVKNSDITITKGLIQIKAIIDFVDPSKIKPVVTSVQPPLTDEKIANQNKSQKKHKKKKKKKE